MGKSNYNFEKKTEVKKKVDKPETKEEVVIKTDMDLSKETVKPITTGVGDVIKNITSSLGIESCEDCEARREKLNRMFSFLRSVKRDLTEEECNYVLDVEAKKNIPESLYFVKLYNEVFGTKVKPCQCPALYRDFLSKLVLQVKKQEIK